VALPFKWISVLQFLWTLKDLLNQTERALTDLQIGVIIHIQINGGRSACINYWGMSLFNLLGNVYAKRIQKRCCELIDLKLHDIQADIRPSWSLTYQVFRSPAKFWKNVEWCQRRLHMSFWSRERIQPGFSWKSAVSVAGVRSWRPLVTELHHKRGSGTPIRVCAVATALHCLF